MSIWASIDLAPGGGIVGLHNATDATNYRGEGTPDLSLDVATTGHHDLIRLAIWTKEAGGGLGLDVLLSVDAARRLCGQLAEAARRVEGGGR